MIRRLKAVSALAAAAALILSGCGGSDSGSSTPSAAPTDKVLHLSFLQDPGQPPDPDIFYAGQGLLLTTNTYEGLLQYKAGTDKPELEPLLATEWTASPDNKVFTFKLREGVTFHDGTPFTSAAVKASFDRRLAVDQGPAYMVKDVESVTTQGDYGVTITLKAPNSAFLDYLACPYGPRMLSPEGLRKNAGSDNAQGYLTTHDLGTGPYVLTAADVGSRYALEAYPGYWGTKPYFEKVEIPVITDVSAQQLQFNNGQLAAILHDLPSSAVQSYLDNKAYANYSLPTMMSNYLYVNPHKGMLTDAKNRTALMQAINVDELVKQTYFGRGDVAGQIYPTNMMGEQYAKQEVPHDPSVLAGIAGGLPADQKAITVGYDSSNPDNQLISNLIQTQLAAAGLTAKVQAYPTSEIYGWIGTDGQAAPEVFTALAWPDAPSPYTWGHISWDPDGGLNYLGCSAPPVTDALARGLPTGSDADFSAAGLEAVKTGCWLNVADVKDFMVAQPWLKGIEAAHVVTNPNSLRLAALSVG
ncbi:peptide/nickel transport system substrate-binding protein [Mycobacterium sp. BK558]|uniref:Putative D,D-dipeptide-binding periplasmic protein DdpA n=1 Tax=Mycolicibacterium chubuense TaxID=1800 RepID=A0A0J6WGW0_MYCCU|nr:ABC transporter substrate-binding protein [Mycolicibacterium chubuense]MBI5339761.1 ABC transporter substrate-binding protein [Mycolicibacterium rufum]RZT19380.1 peptide/nickel transport system substrate-binding protein [Mycobacterium sp. BK558]KMO80962.1 putative D,D-dipeptide-binding periplasmic protein DdpA precursor [Mycolicibacterium chubuense]ORA47314.1 ABC transporter substrate-binding protein [Mycolicibacterium chubuense]SPY00863.1 extracellular solute-binding protein [Mycolicibacte